MLRVGSRNRWLAWLWTTLVVVLAFVPTPLAAQTGGVSLQVEPFFNGHYKFGEWLPLRISIANSGVPLAAEVRVEMSTSGGNTIWLVPVELPSGAQKQFTLYVLPPSFAQTVRVRVVNNAQELAKQNAPLILHQNNEYLVGIIAPRNDAFALLKGVVLTAGSPRSVYPLPITLNDLPERAEGLGTLDALVLSGVDTSALTPAQNAALTAWLRQGGHLVLGGGAGAARTLAGFPDELVGAFRATGNVQEMKRLEAFDTFGETDVKVTGPFVVAVPPRGQTLLQQGNRVLLAQQRVGDGAVLYSALDLAASPFDAWAGTTTFWKKILSPGSAYPLNVPTDVAPGLIRMRYLASAVQNLPALALPSLNVLASLLIAYIALVGPVNFFVLRRFKKLDWGWVTIPALTVFFAAGAFGISNQLRGSNVIINQVSVIDFGADGAAREMETVVGLFSPTRGTYTLELPEGGLVIPISNQYDPFSNQAETGARVEIVETNPLVVRGIELNQAALQSFALASPPPTDWRIETQLTAAGDHVSGTVTNHLPFPLDNVTLVNGERYMALGELAANQTRTLDQNWQMFGGYVGNLVNGNSPGDQARQQILNARFDAWRGSGSFGSAPFLMGWLNTSPVNVRVQNTNAARQAQTLVVAPLNFKYTGTVHVGVGDWNIQEVSASGERSNCGAVNFTGVRNGELVLDFVPLGDFKITNVKALKLVVREAYPQTVELQNTRGEWVNFTFTAPGEFAIETPQAYVGALGAVRMRISSKEAVDRCVFYGLDMQAEVGE